MKLFPLAVSVCCCYTRARVVSPATQRQSRLVNHNFAGRNHKIQRFIANSNRFFKGHFGFLHQWPNTAFWTANSVKADYAQRPYLGLA